MKEEISRSVIMLTTVFLLTDKTTVLLLAHWFWMLR
jgi:hypothetical protein